VTKIERPKLNLHHLKAIEKEDLGRSTPGVYVNENQRMIY
jgi:hypothetical protein